MDDTPFFPSIDDIRRRVCGEYMEMPGLRLTCAQAQRLWGLDEQTCLMLFASLERDGFLHRHTDGRYARLTDGAFSFPPARMARVARTNSLAMRAS
jgi:hypothetical protein